MCVAISCYDSYPESPVQDILSEYPAGTALALISAGTNTGSTENFDFDIIIKQPFTRIVKLTNDAKLFMATHMQSVAW